MRDAVGKRVGDAAIADRIMTQIDEGGLSVLASNPLMLGLIAHTLADSSDGHVVDAASLATQTAVTTRALDGMVARARGGGSATGVSVDVRVMMSDVARLAAGSLLRRMLAELMLEAHVRRTREVTASDAAAALTAARATTHEADGASVARLTAAVWLCARARLVPPLEPRGDASVGCFHLIPQETLAAEALAVRLRTAASTAARGDTAAALAAAARAALGGDDLSRLDEAWWHPVVIALFEQLSDDAADDTMAKDALLETIASRRPEPLVKGMRVEYYDEKFNRYLPGKLTATPSPDSALVELADWNNEPLTGFERRRLRRVPKEGGAATMARAAAAAGATSLVSELVARGVDVATTVDPESLDGALHLATRFGRAETARLLLEEGAGCWPEQTKQAATETGGHGGGVCGGGGAPGALACVLSSGVRPRAGAAAAVRRGRRRRRATAAVAGCRRAGRCGRGAAAGGDGAAAGDDGLGRRAR